MKLLATALVLLRRLSACRPVTYAAVLDLLDACRRRLGRRRTPALLVTPECLSPCIVRTWSPKIVLPESLVTESSLARLRHVLAHELAHLVRGDLCTNGLLLAAPYGSSAPTGASAHDPLLSPSPSGRGLG